MTRRYHVQLPFWIYTGMCLLVGSAAHTSGNNLLYWVFGAMLAGLLLSGLISGMMMISLRVVRLCPAHGVVGEPLIVRYALTNRNWLLPAFNVHIEEAPPAEATPSRGLFRRMGSRLPRLFFWKRGDTASLHWQHARELLGRAESDRGGWEHAMAPARAWVMHVAPRETAHGEAVFWPQRRSAVRFDSLRVWTTFPFGIVKKSMTMRLPQHTLIYPRVFELKREAQTALMPRGPLGTRAVARAGAGDEYFGLRDYRPGDSLRHIAWKRAAGQDHIISIERSQASPPKLRVILNLSVPTRDLRLDPEERLTADELEERAISLAASMLRAADGAGFEVGLTIVGLDIAPSPLRRNQWHLGKMMAALAGIDLTSPRLISRRNLPAEAERAGHIAVHPDRVEPTLGQRDAWHLTARQLESLMAHPGAIVTLTSGPAPAAASRQSRRSAAAALRNPSPPPAPRPRPRRETAA